MVKVPIDALRKSLNKNRPEKEIQKQDNQTLVTVYIDDEIQTEVSIELK